MNQIRSTRSAAVLLVLTLLLTQSCGDSPTEPAPGSIFVTSKTVYEIPEVPQTLTIPFTATNTLDKTIYPRFIQLEKKVGASWVVVYRVSILLEGLDDPLPISPGATLALSISVRLSEFELEIPGAYRAVFMLRHPGEASFYTRSNDFILKDPA
ncbi:MAG: hypothetical protein ACR2GJ_08360 [Gemmatimonadaceae bacterium]|jgi:hypothetical protein